MRRAAALAALAALVLGACAVVSPAAQAAPPKWRKMPSPKPVKAGSLNNVEFVSAKLGWAAGREGDRLAVWKWNGKEWRRASVEGTFAPSGLAVAGPRRAWVTGMDLAVGHALYYNGKKWRKVAFPGPGVPVDLAAGSDGTAVTVAVEPFKGDSSVLRWKDGGWKPWKVSLPKGAALDTVEVRAKDDIWLGGSYSANKKVRALLMHWNGKRWKRLKVGGNSTQAITQIVADKPGAAWALRGSTRTSLVRVDGKRVTDRRLPRDLGALTLTQDGQGGVWMLPYSKNDVTEVPYLRWHKNTWHFLYGPRRDGVPGFGDLDLVPGTTRVVSVGGLDRGGERYPVAEIYR
ncbi:hypothetical protein LO762_13765 [Actinocorallia sp. API 0066]|uniref:hypothetical protein n=1 Tax=Actinocorallia sp. API 0066 TaxID=2896846 RepID=UPI001E635773|nr:hypothetical protein [Actinocorallia sp. API 0066]MCD0450251.1 hypothetical protein [Actinocorallia sp. API 0066]